MASAALMYVALLLFSPLLALVFFLGATLGTALGEEDAPRTYAVRTLYVRPFLTSTGYLCLPSSSWLELSSGVWGCNPALSAAALACVFFPLSPQSVLLGVVGACATFCLQVALMTLTQVMKAMLYSTVVELMKPYCLLSDV